MAKTFRESFLDTVEDCVALLRESDEPGADDLVRRLFAVVHDIDRFLARHKPKRAKGRHSRASVRRSEHMEDLFRWVSVERYRLEGMSKTAAIEKVAGDPRFTDATFPSSKKIRDAHKRIEKWKAQRIEKRKARSSAV